MNELEEIYDESLDEIIDDTDFSFATVGAVYSNGVTLIFDGETESKGKRYKVNADVKIAAGDRVKIHKDSGSYVIEYVKGTPMTRYPLPAGGSDGKFLIKDGATDYSVKWGDVSGTLPTGGTSGQFLKKSSSTDFACEWTTIGTLPTGGTQGQFLKKSSATNYACEWGSIGTLPTGGTQGQFLKKSNANNYACEWASVGTLPTGGSTGQVLQKSAFTDYSCAWADIAVSKVGSASYYAEVSLTNFVPNGTSLTLGSTAKPWTGVYLNGSIQIGTSAYAATIGFFGTTPVSRKQLSSSATLSDVISGLKGYGLFS